MKELSFAQRHKDAEELREMFSAPLRLGAK
jgi:hypothetical protein